MYPDRGCYLRFDPNQCACRVLALNSLIEDLMFSIFDGHIDSHIGGTLPLDHSLDGGAADAGIHHSLDGEAAGTGGGILSIFFVLAAIYKFSQIKVNPTEVIVDVLGILGFQGGGPHGPINGG
jgi:hypothetical protein